MKKLFLLSAFLLSLSCKKDDTYCWECENYSYLSNRVINTQDLCDMTGKEIRDLEEELSRPGMFEYSCRMKD